jgi:hypothetical protein
MFLYFILVCILTTKAEPPPTRDANCDSGTASATGGWRLVRRHGFLASRFILRKLSNQQKMPRQILVTPVGTRYMELSFMTAKKNETNPDMQNNNAAIW